MEDGTKAEQTIQETKATWHEKCKESQKRKEDLWTLAEELRTPKNCERNAAKMTETGRFLWMASDVSNKRKVRREQKKSNIGTGGMERLCCAFHTAHPRTSVALQSQRFMFVSPPAHTKIFRILGEKWIFGVVDVTMGQTDTPRREEWLVSSFSRCGKSSRLRRVMGTSMDAWMPLPSPWGLISIARRKRVASTSRTMTHSRGFRSARHPSFGWPCSFQGWTKILTEQGYSFIATERKRPTIHLAWRRTFPVVRTVQAGWSLSAPRRSTSTEMIPGYGGRTQCLSTRLALCITPAFWPAVFF